MQEYLFQSRGNIQALISDPEYAKRWEVLQTLTEAFADIHWAMACSTNLFLRGIVDEFHDFDIIFDIKDVEIVKEKMEALGATFIKSGGNGFCESDVYLNYQLNSVDIDFIAGFRIITFGTSFKYPFSKDEIEVAKIYAEKKYTIPIVSAEALYVLYYMMEGWQPKRRFKRELLEKYLSIKGIQFKEVFEQCLEKDLPENIKISIRELIEI